MNRPADRRDLGQERGHTVKGQHGGRVGEGGAGLGVALEKQGMDPRGRGGASKHGRQSRVPTGHLAPIAPAGTLGGVGAIETDRRRPPNPPTPPPSTFNSIISATPMKSLTSRP